MRTNTFFKVQGQIYELLKYLNSKRIQKDAANHQLLLLNPLINTSSAKQTQPISEISRHSDGTVHAPESLWHMAIY